METSQPTTEYSAAAHQGRPDRRDDSADFRRQVLGWFSAQLRDTGMPLAGLDVPISNGYSKDTFFVGID